MSRRRRRRKPLVLEELDWPTWVHSHLWLRTPRNEITHERFVRLEALARDFMVEHPGAVATAIAEARARHEDPGLVEVFEVMHPKLKTFAAASGHRVGGLRPLAVLSDGSANPGSPRT